VKKFYTRFVLWLIGPVVRAELKRQESTQIAFLRSELQRRDAGLDEYLRAKFLMFLSRNTIRGSLPHDELKARLHFWQRIRIGLDDLDYYQQEMTAAKKLVARTRRKRHP
jgi:hypothetical protein